MNDTDTTETSRALSPDPWTKAVPRPVRWLLSLLTVGFCVPVWRFPFKVWGPALLSAFLFFMSFAGWDLWPLGYIFAVPLFWSIDACKTAKEAMGISLWMGWIGNFGGFYWVTELLTSFAKLPFVVALPIAVLLSLSHGLVFAAFGWLFFKIRSRTAWPAVLLAPTLWPGVELVTPLIFPNYVGNNQYLVTPMVQIAELLGPLAVSAMVFLANAVVYDLWSAARAREASDRRRLMVGAAVGAALIAANLVFGVVRIGQIEEQQAQAPTLRIGVVEADIGNVRTTEARANMLLAHQRLSQQLEREEKVDLIVWPESTFKPSRVFSSASASREADALSASMRTTIRTPIDTTYLRPSDAPLVTSRAKDLEAGTPVEDRNAVQRGFRSPLLFAGNTTRKLSAEEMRTAPPVKRKKVRGKWVVNDHRIYNSAVLIDEGGFVQGMHHKNNLLAFGEYIPFASAWPDVYRYLPTMEFTPGAEVDVLPFKGHALGVLICLEDILPAFSRKLAARSPDVLVNLTNDAWYGKTHEPHLHLSLSAMRSVETRKWLVRATNTGVSAFIDATGRIVSQTSIYDPETLAHDVPMMKGPPTLYSRLGDALGFLSLGLTAALFFVARKRKRQGGPGLEDA